MTPVQAVVLSHFKISLEALVGRSRHMSLVFARHIAWHFEREAYHRAYPQIGELYERDHTSILIGCRHIAERLAQDDERYLGHVRKIREMLGLAPKGPSPTVPVDVVHAWKTVCPTCGCDAMSELKLRRQLAELQEQVNQMRGELNGRNHGIDQHSKEIA